MALENVYQRRISESHFLIQAELYSSLTNQQRNSGMRRWYTFLEVVSVAF